MESQEDYMINTNSIIPNNLSTETLLKGFFVLSFLLTVLYQITYLLKHEVLHLMAFSEGLTVLYQITYLLKPCSS